MGAVCVLRPRRNEPSDHRARSMEARARPTLDLFARPNGTAAGQQLQRAALQNFDVQAKSPAPRPVRDLELYMVNEVYQTCSGRVRSTP